MRRLVCALVAIVLLFAAGTAVAAPRPSPHPGPPGHKPPVYPPPHHQPPATTPGATCNITVPANPLSAQGLATPYVLSGPDCNEANVDETAFVQATILSPSGQVSVYSPLVIDAGTQPAAPPVVPNIPAGSTVGIIFGFNATTLNLVGPGAWACVNGLPGSDFGQYAYCNTPAFYAAANSEVQAGTLTIPGLGTTTLGAACPSEDSYQLADQDPGDNVASTYLALPDGQIAQDTAANEAAFPTATVLGNPSDNALLTDYVDPALGCSPWLAPNLADPGATVPSTVLDSLQARVYQQAPIADIEESDEMTLVHNQFSAWKTALYRIGDDQPTTGNGLTESDFCTGLYNVLPAFMMTNQALLTAAASPDPAVASNLYTFLAWRYSTATWPMPLPAVGVVPTCTQAIGLADPVTVTYDTNGVAVGATIS